MAQSVKMSSTLETNKKLSQISKTFQFASFMVFKYSFHMIAKNNPKITHRLLICQRQQSQQQQMMNPKTECLYVCDRLKCLIRNKILTETKNMFWSELASYGKNSSKLSLKLLNNTCVC